MKKSENETITDYFLRAERNAAALRNAGEVISDGLLVAMSLKGLPVDYSAFSTVITQRQDNVTFGEFKTALKSFEETVRAKSDEKSEKVMKSEAKAVVCFKCRKPGHKQYECSEKNKHSKGFDKAKWCNICKNKSHYTKECRKNKNNNSAKNVNVDEIEDSHIFAMKVSDFDMVSYNDVNVKGLLVDCGATSHIITDKNKFVRFDPDFDSSLHYIELADGSGENNLVYGKGDARVVIKDGDDCAHKVLLKDALCIPNYKQDIFSVRAATDHGVCVLILLLMKVILSLKMTLNLVFRERIICTT